MTCGVLELGKLVLNLDLGIGLDLCLPFLSLNAVGKAATSSSKI